MFFFCFMWPHDIQECTAVVLPLIVQYQAQYLAMLTWWREFQPFYIHMLQFCALNTTIAFIVEHVRPQSRFSESGDTIFPYSATAQKWYLP